MSTPAFAGFKLKKTGRLDGLNKAGGNDDILKSPSCPPSFFRSQNNKPTSNDSDGENKDPVTSGSKGTNVFKTNTSKTTATTTPPVVVAVEESKNENAEKAPAESTTTKPKPSWCKGSTPVRSYSMPVKDKKKTSNPWQNSDIVVSVVETKKPPPPVVVVEEAPKPKKVVAKPPIVVRASTAPATRASATPVRSKSMPVVTVERPKKKKSPPKRQGSEIVVIVESCDETKEYKVGEAAPPKEKDSGVPDLDEDELRKLNKKNKMVGGSLVTALFECKRCNSDRTHSKPVTIARDGKDYSAQLIQCLDCGRQFHK